MKRSSRGLAAGAIVFFLRSVASALPRETSTHSSEARPLLPSVPWSRWDALAIAIVILTAIAAARWLWEPGLPNQNDLLMSVYRITEMEDAWKQGVFYPRYGLNLNFGYGGLLFNFYPPLVSYVGLALRGLGIGIVETTKLILTLELVVGGAGLFVYARRLLGTRLAATVAGVLYVLSPYVLTVLYERGAMAEGLALALLPWLFWAMHSLLSSGRRRDLVIASALVAAVVMAHNITAFFVVPGVAIYVTALALIQRRARALLPVIGAFALGLGISAYYWLPAMGEIGDTRADEYMLSGAIALRNYVAPILNVVQRDWVHMYTGDFRFALSLWQFILGVAGIVVLFFHRHAQRLALSLLAIAWVIILLLQADFSLGFWEGVPMIRFIQFPWRLFGPASLCVALLGGYLFTLRPLQGKLGWVIAAILGVVLFLLSTGNLRPEKLPLWYAVDDAGVNQADLWERGRQGYPLFSDYAPVGQRLDSAGLTRPRPEEEHSLLPATPLPSQMTLVEHSPLHYVFDVVAEQPWTLRLHHMYFPGWKVTAGAQSVPVTASGVVGVVTAEMPAGTYRVIAEFGNSQLRAVGNMISILSVGLWLALLFPLRKRWQTGVLALILAILIQGGITLLQGPLRPVEKPTAFPATMQDEVRMLAFDVPQTEVCAGDTLPVTMYWQIGETPAVNYKLFLHLAREDDSGVVAQVDTEPLEGFTPMTRWESGEVVRDIVPFPIDAATPPGRYRLLAGLYDPETVHNLIVTSAPNVLPGDRLFLTEIDVCAAGGH